MFTLKWRPKLSFKFDCPHQSFLKAVTRFGWLEKRHTNPIHYYYYYYLLLLKLTQASKYKSGTILTPCKCLHGRWFSVWSSCLSPPKNLSANNVPTVYQKRGQRSAVGHMSVRVQPWQHVSLPNALTFCTDCSWTIKKPAGWACICEYWNVTWEDGELLREKGHFRESWTEQQMPFVSSQIL